jgi:hypothetical protein
MEDKNGFENRDEFLDYLQEAAQSYARMMYLYSPRGPVARLLETGVIDHDAFAIGGCIVTEISDDNL